MGNVLRVINNSVLTVIQEDLGPSRVSMRKGTLKAFGGDLNNLWDIPRFDGNRGYFKNAHKDKRADYRPWQSQKVEYLE